MTEEISPDIISKIRKRVRNGKTKRQVADELNISYYTVKKHTKDIVTEKRISVEFEQQIRKEVKSGKTKIDVANELSVSYYTVKKHTKDITTILRIPIELEQRIRDEVKKGKSVRDVAKELNVSRDTVTKYTRNIPKKTYKTRKRFPELIKQIRENVRKYNSKSETARKMGLTYGIVKWYTRDIPIKRGLSSEKKEKIRNEVKKGKTKTQVAKELQIPLNTVSKNTMDIYKIKKKPDINYKAFLLLEELMNNGYAFSSPRWGLKDYQVLKKKFPAVCRVKMYRKVIFFLEDKSNVAAKAFLEISKKKIISYQELNQIIKVFDTKLEKQDKKKYLQKE